MLSKGVFQHLSVFFLVAVFLHLGSELVQVFSLSLRKGFEDVSSWIHSIDHRIQAYGFVEFRDFRCGIKESSHEGF